VVHAPDYRQLRIRVAHLVSFVSTEATPDLLRTGADMTPYEEQRRVVRWMIIVFAAGSVVFWLAMVLQYRGVILLFALAIWAVIAWGVVVLVRMIKAAFSEDQPTNRPNKTDDDTVLRLLEEEDRRRRRDW